MGNVKCGGLQSANSEKLRIIERIDKLAEELDEEESKVIESADVKDLRVSGNKNGGLVKQSCGVQPKVKKSLIFADNGKVYRVCKRNPELFLQEDYDNDVNRGISAGAKRDLVDDLCREVEEIVVSSKEAEDDDDVVEANCEDGGSLSSSDDDKDLGSYVRSEDNFARRTCDQHETDDFALSAPLPLKMEARTDSIDGRKKLAE